MPLKDANGKRLSGAQERKRAAGQAEAARQRLAAEQADGTQAERLAERREKLGAPNGDAVGNVAYANRCAAFLLHDIMHDPALDETTRRRQAKDFIAVIGMTGVKALYEERLKRVEAKVYGKAASNEDDDGLEDET